MSHLWHFKPFHRFWVTHIFFNYVLVKQTKIEMPQQILYKRFLTCPFECFGCDIAQVVALVLSFRQILSPVFEDGESSVIVFRTSRISLSSHNRAALTISSRQIFLENSGCRQSWNTSLALLSWFEPRQLHHFGLRAAGGEGTGAFVFALCWSVKSSSFWLIKLSFDHSAQNVQCRDE